MALNYRRGSAAIEDAASKRGSGDFRPFIPQIAWRKDGEVKHVLVLTDVGSEIATLLLHQFVPIGKGVKNDGEEYVRYEDFLSRRDPGLGEDYDDLEDRLEREPKTRCMGVMVELEPIMEPGARPSITKFVAKTETFYRTTDDGEVEVTAPVIGLATQSAVTLWGTLNSLWQTLGDLTQVPVAVTRRGTDQNTRYDAIPFQDKPVDLSPVIEYIDGINYIAKDDLPELLNQVEAEETQVGQAQVIADHLLRKRVDELADPQRYKELVGPLTLEEMPKDKWGRKKERGNNSRPSRPARRSPRETTEAPAEAAEATEAELTRAERFDALKKRVEAA